MRRLYYFIRLTVGQSVSAGSVEDNVRVNLQVLPELWSAVESLQGHRLVSHSRVIRVQKSSPRIVGLRANQDCSPYTCGLSRTRESYYVASLNRLPPNLPPACPKKLEHLPGHVPSNLRTDVLRARDCRQIMDLSYIRSDKSAEHRNPLACGFVGCLEQYSEVDLSNTSGIACDRRGKTVCRMRRFHQKGARITAQSPTQSKNTRRQSHDIGCFYRLIETQHSDSCFAGLLHRQDR